MKKIKTFHECENHILFKTYRIIRITVFLLLVSILQTLANDTYPRDAQQQKSVSGTVMDESNQPLPGVTVIIKGTTKGTVTNASGEYKLTGIPDDAVLKFSFVGMASQEIAVDDQTSINVILLSDAIGLEEVVAIGYGTVKKSDLSGAVGTLKGDELDQQINTNVGAALQGKMAGVTVETASGDPGAGVRIQIRGAGSLNNVNPLIIVDGVQVESMNSLSPLDIESIQVLKDASAAAIYGSRASNGVILIETKTGSSGEIKITANADFGIQQIGKKLDLLNTDEWIEVNNAARDAGGMDRIPIALEPEVPGEGIDWQDEIYRNAATQNYNIEASGGTELLKYSFSLGYVDQDGIVKTSGYKRLNLRLKSDLTKGKFKFGETIMFSNEKTSDINGLGGQGGTAVSAATMMIPAFKIYDETALGGYSGAWGPVMDVFNPVAGLNLNEDETDYYKVLANVYGEFEIMKGLKYKLNLGATINETKGFSYKPRYQVGSIFRNEMTTLSEYSGMSKYWQIENTISYNKEFGKHSINAVIGQTSYKNQYRQLSGSKKGMPDGIYVLDAGTSEANSGGYQVENTLLSYLGRAIYSYDNRYIITATFRRDGSSRFSEENRWGNFPSLSAAWNIANEEFFRNMGTSITQLKLRGSYGILGNQEIGDYQYMGLITSAISYTVGNPSKLWVGNIQTNYPAVGLKWESTATSNIGMDLSLWSGKVNFVFDYFRKKTTDVLLRVPIPLSVGASSDPFGNAGEIANNGFEATAIYNGNLKDFNFSVTGTLSSVKNEALALSTGTQQISGARASHHGAAVTYTREGYPLYSFFLIETDGLFRSEQEVLEHSKDGQQIQPNAVPGDIRFVDANNDGKIDGKDRVYSGSPFPDFNYGLRLEGDWRNFDFSLFLQGSEGNKIYNGFNTYLEAVRVNTNYSSAVLNSYTFNPDSDFPRLDMADPNGNGVDNSDRFLEDGSYLRLKTLQMGYTFPKSFLNKISFNNLRLYMAAENLFTLSNYSGYNPDIGGNGLSSRGVDFRVYPINRSYHIGLQLNF